MPFEEVLRLRKPLGLLRDVFGDARMEPVERYADWFRCNGLVIDQETNLSSATRPTFARWRDNALCHRTEVVAALGQPDWERFVESCAVLEGFWDDGALGYCLLAASKS
jgi:cyclopropane fatty-acyl-phospholipid synthase-like methyltransferase